jgi:hypothetical protein
MVVHWTTADVSMGQEWHLRTCMDAAVWGQVGKTWIFQCHFCPVGLCIPFDEQWKWKGTQSDWKYSMVGWRTNSCSTGEEDRVENSHSVVEVCLPSRCIAMITARTTQKTVTWSLPLLRNLATDRLPPMPSYTRYNTVAYLLCAGTVET